MTVYKNGIIGNIRDFACDIAVQAGQSNAQGNGCGGTPYEPIPDVLFAYPEYKAEDKKDIGITVDYSGNIIVTDNCEDSNNGAGNFAAGFVPKYAANFLASDRKLLILQTAIGGTGFARRQWGLGDPIYKKTVEITDWALSLNKENKLIALLWHQGEHDAFENADWDARKRFDVHFGNIGKLVKDFRKRFGNVPFICGDFTKKWRDKNSEAASAVASAMRRACLTEGNARFVETNNLSDNDSAVGNGDEIHFCRESLVLLGEEYYNSYCGLKA